MIEIKKFKGVQWQQVSPEIEATKQREVLGSGTIYSKDISRLMAGYAKVRRITVCEAWRLVAFHLMKRAYYAFDLLLQKYIPGCKGECQKSCQPPVSFYHVFWECLLVGKQYYFLYQIMGTPFQKEPWLYLFYESSSATRVSLSSLSFIRIVLLAAKRYALKQPILSKPPMIGILFEEILVFGEVGV